MCDAQGHNVGGHSRASSQLGESWLALLTTLAKLAIGHTHTIQKKRLTVPELRTVNWACISSWREVTDLFRVQNQLK